MPRSVLRGQIQFLLQLLLFGVASGSAIFVAQFWGKHDVPNIRRVLGMSLIIGLFGALVFSVLALGFPQQTLGFYSTDAAVIDLGSNFLRIAGLGYIAVPIINAYGVTLRSTGHVRLPVTIGVLSLTLGAILNYGLIFGNFGLPTMGVEGAAVSATIARWFECLALLFLAYSSQSVAAASVREMVAFDSKFIGNIVKTMLPVVINEVIWSTGISMYSVIYARIGTESVAAVSIAGSIETLAYVPFVAVANSAAIMIGHRIGADEEHKAMDYAKRFIMMNVAASLVIGSIIFLSAPFLLRFYQIDAVTQEYARNILTIMALMLWIKTSNLMLIVGVLRAGGDARVSALIDVGPLWLVGLPMATIGAFVFGLPVYWVYLLTMTDEIGKWLLALWRMISKRWINNLARQHARLESA